MSHEPDSVIDTSECPLVYRLRQLAKSISSAMLDEIHYADTIPWVAANHIVNLTSKALWENEDAEKRIATLRDELSSAHARIAELQAKVAVLEDARIASHARLTVQDSTIGLE